MRLKSSALIWREEEVFEEEGVLERLFGCGQMLKMMMRLG